MNGRASSAKNRVKLIALTPRTGIIMADIQTWTFGNTLISKFLFMGFLYS
jgi:hypothetical protein